MTDMPPDCQSVSSAPTCSRDLQGQGRGTGREVEHTHLGRLRSRCRGIRVDIAILEFIAQTLDALHAGEPIALIETDQAHALRIAADDGYIGHRCAHTACRSS